MSIEADLRDLVREALKLALRDELPALLRDQLAQMLQRDASVGERGRVLSTPEAAEYAGVSPATIRSWVSAGQLRAQRAGRVLKVRKADLDAFLVRSAPREDGVIDLSERAREILSGKKRSRE